MNVKEKEPPDFSTWILEKHFSRFCGPNGIINKEPNADDMYRNMWIGDLKIYKDKNGFGLGKELLIFAKQSVLKFWGLKGEKNYSFFAILKDGRWITFSAKIYKLDVSYNAGVNGARIVASRIKVVIRANEEVAAELEVRRD